MNLSSFKRVIVYVLLVVIESIFAGKIPPILCSSGQFSIEITSFVIKPWFVRSICNTRLLLLDVILITLDGVALKYCEVFGVIPSARYNLSYNLAGKILFLNPKNKLIN